MSSMYNPDNGQHQHTEFLEKDAIAQGIMTIIDQLQVLHDEFAVLREDFSELRQQYNRSQIQCDRPFQPVSITINNGPDHQPRCPKNADSVDSE